MRGVSVMDAHTFLGTKQRAAIPILTSFLRHIKEIGIRLTLFFESKNEISTDFPDYPDCVTTVHTL
jgi:hypothetical protein